MKTQERKTIKKGSNSNQVRLIPILLKTLLPEFSPQKRNFVAANLYKLINNEKIYLQMTARKSVGRNKWVKHFLMIDALNRLGIPYISEWEGPVITSNRFIKLDEQLSRPFLRVLKIYQISFGEV